LYTLWYQFAKRLVSVSKRLAAAIVDNCIGKLRAILRSTSRSDTSSTAFTSSNPVAHPMFKQYVSAIREEQAHAHVVKRQAIPLFFDKFTSICSYLKRKALSERNFTNRSIAICEGFGVLLHRVVFGKPRVRPLARKNSRDTCST
jgi:hypothetical protein